MLKAAQMASRNYVADQPPPYSPPTSQWYAAPPPAYAANPSGYQGWVPPTNVFPDVPQQGTVYMTDLPPPCEYFLTSHCSKSLFFVQKRNFDFPRKIVDFLGGEKLVKILGFCGFCQN